MFLCRMLLQLRNKLMNFLSILLLSTILTINFLTKWFILSIRILRLLLFLFSNLLCISNSFLWVNHLIFLHTWILDKQIRLRCTNHREIFSPILLFHLSIPLLRTQKRSRSLFLSSSNNSSLILNDLSLFWSLFYFFLHIIILLLITINRCRRRRLVIMRISNYECR